MQKYINSGIIIVTQNTFSMNNTFIRRFPVFLHLKTEQR